MVGTSTPRLPGIDVSLYQGVVDWHLLAEHGLKFAAIKASEGLAVTDPRFAYNWAESAHFGLIRCAYHFLRPAFSGKAQADHLHDVVRSNGHFVAGDGILLDIEDANRMTPAQIVQCAEQFVQRARHTTNRPVIIYTSPGFWGGLGNPRSPLLQSCPLWVASWGSLRPPNIPNLAVPSFWQYSSTGLEPGIHGAVDLDWFMGTVPQLRRLLGASHGPGTPQPPHVTRL